MERFEYIKDDITKMRVDAIVNSATAALLGGGGIDGLIRRAAGPRMATACRELGGCKTGEAKITPGFRLPAKWVIHTVGPMWEDGSHREPELLASCYRNSLALAVQHSFKTIAFSAISTDVYGFPIGRAAEIAVHEIGEFLKTDNTVKMITMVCFDQTHYMSYKMALFGRNG